MVEADDGEAAGAGAPPRVEMRSGIDQEAARGIVGKVRAPDGVDDRGRRAEQQAAALVGRGHPGVRGNLSQHRRHDANGYRASTANAMPMPPPMHSDATP